MPNTNRTADDAAADWLQAKKEENAANARRIDAENELIAFLGTKPEGSKTHNLEAFKVVIEGKIDRKIDFAVYDTLKIPEGLEPVKTKREPDVRGIKFLEENHPDVYKTLSMALTVKPAKTSVTVTRVEK